MNKKTSPSESSTLFLIMSVLVILLALGLGGYLTFSEKSLSEQLKPAENISSGSTNEEQSGFFTTSFADYSEEAVSITPKIPPYSIEKDLSNVENLSDFSLSDQAKDLLIKNKFVVQRGQAKEFFPLYETNRYGYIPNFVTTDSILHNYHLMFDHLLKKLEQEKLIPELKALNTSMLSAAVGQYKELKGTSWENAAKRIVGFFAVGSKLMDASITVPDFVKNEVDQELALIEAHEKIKESPVMNLGSKKGVAIESPQGLLELEALKEDYSQYIPRGHYDKTDDLKAYFKSMMWYGRLGFRFKNDDEIKSAILITMALNENKNASHWNKLYEPINFFVGKSDDVTYYQFKELIEKVYGNRPDLNSMAGDQKKLSEFIEKTKSLEPPQLNSIPIFNTELQPDREKEIKGFRFMGQRFTIDASIFQRLIDREVKGRMLPKGLDIPAALGSEEALNILKTMNETEYPNYSENMNKLQAYLAGLPTDTWTQNLYWGWLYALRPLLDEFSGGYPSFMQNSSWVRKELNTFLGSWTELKHDTILYAKQVYAELGGGGPEEKDDRGYVEPVPEVYARLAGLLKMTTDGLKSRELLSDTMQNNLNKMRELALSLKNIAEKELNGKPLSEDDYELIRSYGGQLEHFWLEVNKDEPEFKQMGQVDYLNENPAALVSDVATDPNGQVLEEATGWINEIFVIVPVDGKLRLTKGGVYSYYEFPWPLSDRLTDKKWRELLTTGKAPALPSWTNSFVAQ